MANDFVVFGTWEGDKWISREVKIIDLSNEELLAEYASEVDASTRRISTDPPSPEEELKTEILKRMARDKNG